MATTSSRERMFATPAAVTPEQRFLTTALRSVDHHATVTATAADAAPIDGKQSKVRIVSTHAHIPHVTSRIHGHTDASDARARSVDRPSATASSQQRRVGFAGTPDATSRARSRKAHLERAPHIHGFNSESPDVFAHSADGPITNVTSQQRRVSVDGPTDGSEERTSTAPNTHHTRSARHNVTTTTDPPSTSFQHATSRATTVQPHTLPAI